MIRHTILAAALIALLAGPAAAESEPATGATNVKDKQLALQGWWDPSRQSVDDADWRTYLANNTLEAYLSLKPRTEVGNAPHIPGILRGGLCSDPAGEGH